jgi:hypothetical protein
MRPKNQELAMAQWPAQNSLEREREREQGGLTTYAGEEEATMAWIDGGSSEKRTRRVLTGRGSSLAAALLLPFRVLDSALKAWSGLASSVIKGIVVQNPANNNSTEQINSRSMYHTKVSNNNSTEQINSRSTEPINLTNKM